MQMNLFGKRPWLTAHDHFSKADPSGRVGQFFNFPLARIFVVALFLAPLLMVNSILVFQLIERTEEPLASQIDMVRMVLVFPLLLICYHLYCRAFEKRPAAEISGQGSLREIALGMIMGGGAVSFCVLVLALCGSYTVLGLNSFWVIPKSAVLFGTGALFQDLLFLAVVFRLMEELAGSWLAAITSLGLFSLAHAGNPNATIFSTNERSCMILPPPRRHEVTA